MKFKIKNMISNNLKNVGKISFGTILGQGISIITLPIFTRIYGAEVIGMWALINSTAIIVNSFSDLGLSNSIMIEQDDEKALDLYKSITTIVACISLIMVIIIYVYNYLLSNNRNTNIIISIIIGVLIFLLQQIQICYTWLNRNKEYNILMKNPLINNLSIAVIALLLAIFGFKEYGYYIGILSGHIVTLIHMKKHLPKGVFCFDKNIYKNIFESNKKFIKYQLPSNVLMQIKGQLPTILIKLSFGIEILGYYSVAVRLLNMPITFLANALGKVFFQQASEIKYNKGDVGEFTLNNLQKGMKLAFLPILGLITIGDILIISFFGSKYNVSANILRIMVIYSFFLFLSMSVNGIAIVLDKQKYLMISGICQIFGFSIGIFIGKYIFDSIYISVFLLSIIFILIQIIYFCLIFKSVNISIIRYLQPLSKQFLVLFTLYLVIRGSLFLLGIVNRF